MTKASEGTEGSIIPLPPENVKESFDDNAKWINNDGAEVEEVFGFNNNAELINGRAAMVGFLMLIITEIVFNGEPVTRSIFGIN